MKNFTQYFMPLAYRCPTLRIVEPTKTKIRDFVERIVDAKMKERIHQIDNDAEIKRWITGVSGELAVEKLLGVEFFDWSIGQSDVYNVADLRQLGLDVGIKTVEYGKFPVIHKKSTRPEIIVIKEDDRYYVCGVATVDVLNKYQDDNLVLNKKLRARNVKTGFYGFEQLRQFRSFEELKDILNTKQAKVS